MGFGRRHHSRQFQPLGDPRRPRGEKGKGFDARRIGRIWHACDRLGPTPASKAYGRLIQFLLTTGQRRDEAAGLRFGHILDGVWRMGSDNKSGRPHSVPLPPLAMQIVGTGEARDLVFPGGAGTKLTAGRNSSAVSTNLPTLKIGGFTISGERAPAAGRMAALISLVIEALLNHTLPGTAATYMRAEMQARKEVVLVAWAAELERIVGKRRAVS